MTVKLQLNSNTLVVCDHSTDMYYFEENLSLESAITPLYTIPKNIQVWKAFELREIRQKTQISNNSRSSGPNGQTKQYRKLQFSY